MFSRSLLLLCHLSSSVFFFFFNDPATTEIYTLSLHDALPIFAARAGATGPIPLSLERGGDVVDLAVQPGETVDRKSTRLNSSHTVISYAVFCLKKKKKNITEKNKYNRENNSRV